MYLYRAINENDLKNYIENKKIVASKIAQNANDMINDIAYHVENASSNKQRDCWISTGKDLNIIVKEYAIPQGGGYNTGNERKRVAVIDSDYWKKINRIGDCYTVFLNGKKIIIDFSTITTKDRKEKSNEIAKIKTTINNNFSSGSMKALFDCSQYGDCKRPFNEMSIMRFSKARNGFGLFDRGLTAVQNGIAQKAKEVLCYKEIPEAAIAIVLSPLQEDILYLLNEQEQAAFIRELRNGKKVEWDEEKNWAEISENNNIITVSGEKWMYPDMVYKETAKRCMNNPSYDLEKTYEELLTKKKDFLISVINKLGHNYNEQKEIPEKEGLWVIDFDKSNECVEKEKDQLYDLAALKYKGKLYTIRETGLSNIGVIGEISKKTNGVIKELIENKKLFCSSLMPKE